MEQRLWRKHQELNTDTNEICLREKGEVGYLPTITARETDNSGIRFWREASETASAKLPKPDAGGQRQKIQGIFVSLKLESVTFQIHS